MARRVIWTNRAVLDRYQIYEFWTQNNQSENYSKKLELLFQESANLIAQFPEVGTNTDINGVRVKVVRTYKIFYSITESEITILRIWDARQNPEQIDMK
jgi:plasmid stabilization system protein ParE